MKKLCYIFSIFILLTSSLASAQVWTQKTSFPGQARDAAVMFAIGSNIYFGGGYAASAVKDFYEYNTLTDTWTKKGNLPNTLVTRAFSVSFSIGNKGYMGMGQDGETIKSDFWEYDPSSDTWTKLPDYPTGPRDGLVSFVIGSKAYIGSGLGEDNFYHDEFWEYDPATKNWRELEPMPFPSLFLSGFAIGDYGYITCGSTGSKDNPEYTQLYRYDVSKDIWEEMQAFPGGMREAATSFSLNGLGYIGFGQKAYQVDYQDFYAYDPSANSWSKVIDMPPMKGRAWAAAVTVNDKVYFGGGADFDNTQSFYTKDWWELSFATADVKMHSSASDNIALFPNPARNTVMIQAPSVAGAAAVTVVDAAGHVMLSSSMMNGTMGSTLNISNLPTGEYFLKINGSNNQVLSKKLIKQ